MELQYSTMYDIQRLEQQERGCQVCVNKLFVMELIYDPLEPVRSDTDAPELNSMKPCCCFEVLRECLSYISIKKLLCNCK